MPPRRLVLIDIDGLRRDVFTQALAAGALPHLARLLGGADAGAGLHFEPVSNAPSITFCCQSSIFTGAHPEQHGIMGNQFFDRFGRRTGGMPRHYAFDVGDTLAVDDAVRVFTGPAGLIGETLAPETPTLYEHAAARGLTSTVAFNMIARGATHWLKPNLVDIARFTKGGGLLGISAEQYDGQMVAALTAHLRAGARPDVLTAYFMGLDHHSHEHGPDHQTEYLTRVVDAQVGGLTAELERAGMFADTLFAIVSDHGQIGVVADDRHALRLGFPFDREMGYLFDALGLDVHDKPGEGPHCDAVVACNGGLAHVYLKHRAGAWADPPRFETDVLPVARAFWAAHQTGQHAPDLLGALALVLVRAVERDGWDADYRALTPAGQLVPIAEFLAAHPEIQMVEAAQRLRHLAAPVSGDVVLAANYAAGFYFGAPLKGVHGGLHPDDSEAVLSLGWPAGARSEPAQTAALRAAAQTAVAERCRSEGGRRAGIVDLLPAVMAALGWSAPQG
ncbi:MAG: alkaline phosphatase family protein [Anaerolineales bacterium]|nr:alkaline phosphatase family protein [Anaerolineales bacterium]